MALSQRTPKLLGKSTPPMRVVPLPRRVPDPPPKDTLGEEFLFANGVRAPAASGLPRIRPRVLLRGLVAVCLAVALVLVVRNFTGSKPQPTPAPVAAAHPAAPVVPAAPAPAGVPMFVVSSSLSPASAPQSYSASVTVRNPTDVTADDVTVTVTLRDAAGRVVATQTRSFATMRRGRNVTFTVTGELDPSAGAPTSLEVSAFAARLEARA